MKALAAALMLSVATAPVLATAADAQGRGNGRGQDRKEQKWEQRRGDGERRGPEARGRDRERAEARRLWRRGDTLPPDARRGVVRDPYRFGLYPPPRGHAWVRVGQDMYLMAPNGQVREVVRDSY
jgi:Ni/Co efflux regulator RcnB